MHSRGTPLQPSETNTFLTISPRLSSTFSLSQVNERESNRQAFWACWFASFRPVFLEPFKLLLHNNDGITNSFFVSFSDDIAASEKIHVVCRKGLPKRISHDLKRYEEEIVRNVLQCDRNILDDSAHTLYSTISGRR